MFQWIYYIYAITSKRSLTVIILKENRKKNGSSKLFPFISERSRKSENFTIQVNAQLGVLYFRVDTYPQMWDYFVKIWNAVVAHTNCFDGSDKIECILSLLSIIYFCPSNEIYWNIDTLCLVRRRSKSSMYLYSIRY